MNALQILSLKPYKKTAKPRERDANLGTRGLTEHQIDRTMKEFSLHIMVKTFNVQNKERD